VLPDDTNALGGPIDLEKKRGLNPWVIFGVALFAVAFVFGRRCVARKTPRPGDDCAFPDSSERQPS